MSAAEGSELSPDIAEKTCRGEFVFPDGSRFSEKVILLCYTVCCDPATLLLLCDFFHCLFCPGGDYVLRNDIPVRHGKGKQISVAQEFDGEFVDDSMHGTGTLLFASGAKYEGSFVAN